MNNIISTTECMRRRPPESVQEAMYATFELGQLVMERLEKSNGLIDWTTDAQIGR